MSTGASGGYDYGKTGGSPSYPGARPPTGSISVIKPTSVDDSHFPHRPNESNFVQNLYWRAKLMSEFPAYAASTLPSPSQYDRAVMACIRRLKQWEVSFPEKYQLLMHLMGTQDQLSTAAAVAEVMIINKQATDILTSFAAPEAADKGITPLDVGILRFPEFFPVQSKPDEAAAIYARNVGTSTANFFMGRSGAG